MVLFNFHLINSAGSMNWPLIWSIEKIHRYLKYVRKRKKNTKIYIRRDWVTTFSISNTYSAHPFRYCLPLKSHSFVFLYFIFHIAQKCTLFMNWLYSFIKHLQRNNILWIGKYIVHLNMWSVSDFICCLCTFDQINKQIVDLQSGRIPD